MRRWMSIGLLLAGLAACRPNLETAMNAAPTATFLPIPSALPRYTATPVPTRTPLPTFTFTPTNTPVPPTNTLSPTPTLTPTIVGIVQSMQRVNVREGPGTSFREIDALAPGTGVQILGQDASGAWLNVRLEDGREGWVSARLVFLPPTPTLVVTPTLLAGAAALLGGTPLPTAILGGGTITPTLPPNVVSPTPPNAPTRTPTSAATSQPFIPIINLDSLNLTATALVSNAATPSPTITIERTPERVLTLQPTQTFIPGVTLPPPPTAGTPQSIAPAAPAEQVNRPGAIDVFAFCDRPAFGLPAPTVRAGSEIDIYWAWFAREEQQVRDHIDASTVDLRVNGTPIANVNQYRTAIRQQGLDYVAYWYVPYGPLEAGDYEITYVVTWSRAISDGYQSFGPNTAMPFEQESCRFRVVP